MNLYILRHGLAAMISSASLEADRRRPLTAKGRKKVRKIAAAMKEMGLSLDLILSSPCLRAQQTARIVAEAFDAEKRLELMNELAAGEPAHIVVEALSRARLPENLLLVGHEPQLGRLVSLLLTGSTDLFIRLKKGGLCKLALREAAANGGATLEWLLTPKQLARMSGREE